MSQKKFNLQLIKLKKTNKRKQVGKILWKTQQKTTLNLQWKNFIQ